MIINICVGGKHSFVYERHLIKGLVCMKKKKSSLSNGCMFEIVSLRYTNYI